jgi:hypothetical protein
MRCKWLTPPVATKDVSNAAEQVDSKLLFGNRLHHRGSFGFAMDEFFLS